MDSTSMMSPADFAAMSGNNFGGNNIWWLIILLFLGNGGIGWGNRFNDNAYTQTQALMDTNFNNLERTVQNIENRQYEQANALQKGLADGFYSVIDAIRTDGEKTRGLIQQNEVQNLRDRVQSLEADNRMCGVVRYPMGFTYAAQNPFCNCGNGCNGNI